MSVPFDINTLVSSTIWGPPAEVPTALSFSNIPYAPFSKGDKIGKVADWEKNSLDNKDKVRKNQRDYFHAYGASAATSFSVEAEDEGNEFEIVDNNKSQAKPQQTTTLLRNKKTGGIQQSGFQKNNISGNNQTTNNQSGFQKNSAPRRQAYGSWRDAKNERVRESSLKIDDAWKVVSDIEFSKLTKLNFEVKEGEELDTYGVVNAYNKKMEKATQIPLRHIETVAHNKTASADPVIKSLEAKNTANVYTTDTVLSQLMCASRSIYSWDIVVTKKNGTIFLDKRESSNIDKLTVDENSQEAPSDSNDTNINNVRNLSTEATLTNQYYLANIVAEEPTIKLANANPFSTAGEKTSSKGYKYKKYTLSNTSDEESPITIVVRSEFDSKDTTTGQTLLIKSVNEYTKTNLDWKTKYASQRGAIIAAELKNNNNKFAKWTNQAILAGVDSIKLGFISRVNFKDNTKHQIVGVSSYTPTDLAQQINFSTGNGWGIVKSYIDFINHEEDGRFLILKNANAPKLTLYKIPENAARD